MQASRSCGIGAMEPALSARVNEAGRGRSSPPLLRLVRAASARCLPTHAGASAKRRRLAGRSRGRMGRRGKRKLQPPPRRVGRALARRSESTSDDGDALRRAPPLLPDYRALVKTRPHPLVGAHTSYFDSRRRERRRRDRGENADGDESRMVASLMRSDEHSNNSSARRRRSRHRGRPHVSADAGFRVQQTRPQAIHNLAGYGAFTSFALLLMVVGLVALVCRS